MRVRLEIEISDDIRVRQVVSGIGEYVARHGAELLRWVPVLERDMTANFGHVSPRDTGEEIGPAVEIPGQLPLDLTASGSPDTGISQS